MNKAVFLDRDGVINKEIGDYVYKKEDFIFNTGLFTALRLLQEYDYKLIVVTNQGGIAKGKYTNDEVNELHNFMLEKLLEEGIKIDDLYICPHHHTIAPCLCRKPNSLMIEKAIAKHEIETSLSYLIGDNERDILAAEKVMIKGIMIESNTNILPRVKMDILNVV
tara:strand:- start:9974 stop:10468 length:495 start_codon:yes stop_codon:yes gene_type:complete